MTARRFTANWFDQVTSKLRGCSLLLGLFVFACSTLKGATVTWGGAASTAWGTKGNWSTNTVPTSTDNATFNAAYAFAPSLGSSAANVGGVWMTTGVTSNVTIGGTAALTLSGNTISGNVGLGILVDNTSTYTLTINAPLTVGSAQSWMNNSGNLLTVSAVNLNANALTIKGTGNTTISGVISGSTTAGTLTKAGAGTLSLSGTNSFIGALAVQAGTLSIATINNASISGTLGNSAIAVTLGNTGGVTGTLEYSGGTASSTKTFTMATGGTGAFQIDTTGTTLTLSGVIGGSGALSKTGSGILALTGANTYSGGTVINAGTLVANTSASLGASGAVTTINAGTLELSASFSSTRNFVLNNAASTIMVDPTQTFTVGNVLSGSGALNKTGTGTLQLNGANTYTGATNVSAGAVILGAGASLTTSALNVSSGATFTGNATATMPSTMAVIADGSVNFNSSTRTIASLNGASTGVVTLNTTNLSVGSGSYAGILQNGASAGSLTQTGAGTLTLTGVNTFTGSTTISAGTLTLAASGNALNNTSGITVNTGGTLLLGGSNQISNTASITLAGGTFAKGNFSEGSATAPSAGVGALTLTAAASHIDFGTGTVGTLAFASLTTNGFTITIDNWTGTYNQVGSASTDRLIFATSQTANLGSFAFTGYGTGGTQFDLGNGYFEVVPTVPEPATYAAALLALVVAAYPRIRARARRQM